MKKTIYVVLVLIFQFAGIASAYTAPPRPDGPVNDFANIIDEQKETELESFLSVFDQEGRGTVVVATIPDLGDETIETYAVKLFEDWGIGDKELDDGLLLLVAPNDREVRIEVGYGLEPIITDAYSGSLIRNDIIPAFREGDYTGGIDIAVSKIVTAIRAGVEAVPEVDKSATFWGFFNTYTEIVLFVLFFGINIMFSIFAKSKSWWLGGLVGVALGVILGFAFGFIYTGIISIVVFGLIGLFVDYILSKIGPRSGGGGHWMFFGGGGGRGGFGGGGFGGFGGGMSGGGGSSGRW